MRENQSLSSVQARILTSLDKVFQDYEIDATIVQGDTMTVLCGALTSLIANRTIEEVISNNIGALNGLKISISLTHIINLDRASLRAVINGLADLTGQTAQTLTLGATLMAKLTEEDIAIATNKNWTII